MPYSHAAPKPWAMERIGELRPAHVLDVGPGAGEWATHLRDRTVTIEVDCIEAFGPYVERFQLAAKYDQVIVGDVRTWDWGGMDYVTVAESPDPIGQGHPKWTWDLVICGDVLEHMSKDEARAVVEQALVHAPAVLVVIPLGECPQGESEGNALEAHVATWELADIDALPKMNDYQQWHTDDGYHLAAAILGVWP